MQIIDKDVNIDFPIYYNFTRRYAKNIPKNEIHFYFGIRFAYPHLILTILSPTSCVLQERSWSI